jgi:hypothetical protein
VVNGDKSYEVQKLVVDRFNELIKENLGQPESWSVEYPDGKKPRSKRFVFHKASFANMENDVKEKFKLELDSLLRSIGKEFRLTFSAEWSRTRE